MVSSSYFPSIIVSNANVRLASQFPDWVGAAGFHSAGLVSDDRVRGVLDFIPAVKARVYLGHADQDPHLMPTRLALSTGHWHKRASTELLRGAMYGFTIPDSAAYQAEAVAHNFKQVFELFEGSIADRVVTD